MLLIVARAEHTWDKSTLDCLPEPNIPGSQIIHIDKHRLLSFIHSIISCIQQWQLEDNLSYCLIRGHIDGIRWSFLISTMVKSVIVSPYECTWWNTMVLSSLLCYVTATASATISVSFPTTLVPIDPMYWTPWPHTNGEKKCYRTSLKTKGNKSPVKATTQIPAPPQCFLWYTYKYVDHDIT